MALFLKTTTKTMSQLATHDSWNHIFPGQYNTLVFRHAIWADESHAPQKNRYKRKAFIRTVCESEFASILIAKSVGTLS